MADLSPEHLAEIKKISALPREQQQTAVQQFLKKLSPEQVKALQEMQKGGGECIFCLIANGKTESFTLYSDDSTVAVLDIRPATKGHTLVFPKQHFSLLSQLPPEQQAHTFLVAQQVAGVLFSALGCSGTSVVLNQGAGAGQAVPHACFHVLPRYDNDGLELAVNGEPAKKEDLQTLVKQIAETLSNAMNSVVSQKKPNIVIPKEPEEPEDEEDDLFDERIP